MHINFIIFMKKTLLDKIIYARQCAVKVSPVFRSKGRHRMILLTYGVILSKDISSSQIFSERKPVFLKIRLELS